MNETSIQIESDKAAAGSPVRKGRVDPKSVAVLPFVNVSSDPEHEYLSDGFTEDLITALSQVDGLRVPARTSCFAFKGKSEDVRQIGARLGVAAILEGSIRKAGGKLRLTAQLISVASGFHLWSDKFDCAMPDIFSIQDEIIRSIVDALKVRLAVPAGAPLVKRPTQSTEAYQLYLKGRYFWNHRGHGLKKGSSFFEIALLEDPNFALAYTGLADTYNLLGFYGRLPSFEAGTKAKAAALKALELDSSLAEAHSSLGFARLIFDWDLAAAEMEFRAALALNGQYVLAHNWYARLLSITGKHSQAIARDKRAIEIDPLSTYTNMHLGWILLNARRYDEAVRQLLWALEMNPLGLRARCLLGQAYLFQGKIAEAIVELQKAKANSRQNEWAVAALGHAQAVAGDRAEAEAALSELTARSEREPVRPTLFALVHAGLGETDKAIAWLNEACRERDCWMPLVKPDPAFDGLRADSRFAGIMKDIGPP